MEEKQPVWEDLVNDYLEVSANLKEPERLFLIRCLKKEKVQASHIAPYSSFQVADKLVVVCKEPYEECWFYDPSKKRIGRNKRTLSAHKINGAKAPVCK